MSVNVIAWPPVGVIGAEWTEVAPVQVSRSILTGAERLSATQRIRRMVRLTVPAIGRDTMGAGYMEMLKRHLAGIHLVRLNSYPINWYLDSRQYEAARSSRRLNWEDDDTEIDWTDDTEVILWFDGTILSGATTVVGSQPALTVTGLPPNTLVARPGEFVTVYPNLTSDTVSYTAQVTAPAYSNAEGEATILLFDALPTGGVWERVNIGTSQTAVFRPESYPRAVQPLSGNWSYEWSFREVFEDEVGTFNEINPWGPS